MEKNVVLEGVLNAVTAIPPIAYLIIFIAALGKQRIYYAGCSGSISDPENDKVGSNKDGD